MQLHAPQTTPILLTRDEAAARLSICVRMLDTAIHTGKIETVKIGRAVRIRQEALEAFISKNTRPATA